MEGRAMPWTIDRTRPPYKDDPVIAALTDEQLRAVAEVMARLAASYARKLEAEGVTAADLAALGSMTTIGARPG
jgi:hypothetical protein